MGGSRGYNRHGPRMVGHGKVPGAGPSSRILPLSAGFIVPRLPCTITAGLIGLFKISGTLPGPISHKMDYGRYRPGFIPARLRRLRLVAYDGTNYFYGPWFQETAVWERQWFTVKLSSSATAFKAGFQFEQTSGMSAIFKADEFMLCRGATPQFYQEHPNDRSLICQDWDNDGTLVPARGIVRAIPYQASGRCTGRKRS